MIIEPTAYAAIEFWSDLVEEHSAGPSYDMGRHYNRMELKQDTPCIIWNWGPRPGHYHDEAVIGLVIEDKAVVDYDGVFDLPHQAAALLKMCGFNTDQVQ